MTDNMSMTYDEQKAVWRFFNGEAPAKEIFLTHQEAKFIAMSLKRDKWRYDLMDQTEYDSDNIDFSGEISEEKFIDLCMEEIDCNVDLYGDDYEPDIEEIVFDVANDNGIWRD